MEFYLTAAVIWLTHSFAIHDHDGTGNISVGHHHQEDSGAEITKNNIKIKLG